jgi:hypothetical protein
VVRFVDFRLNTERIARVRARTQILLFQLHNYHSIDVTYLVLRESICLAPPGAFFADLRHELLQLHFSMRCFIGRGSVVAFFRLLLAREVLTLKITHHAVGQHVKCQLRALAVTNLVDVV